MGMFSYNTGKFHICLLNFKKKFIEALGLSREKCSYYTVFLIEEQKTVQKIRVR